MSAREMAAAMITNHKIDHGCNYCGRDLRDDYVDIPAWMVAQAYHLDHLPGMPKARTASGKLIQPSDLIRGGYSLSRIMTELERCQVLCANCHAILTAMRRLR